jgi:hypothetical protein
VPWHYHAAGKETLRDRSAPYPDKEIKFKREVSELGDRDVWNQPFPNRRVVRQEDFFLRLPQSKGPTDQKSLAGFVRN